MDKFLKNINRWLIPPGFRDSIISALEIIRCFIPARRFVLGHNKLFQNKHGDKRCFILGTGPSMNTQDLRPLKNEICISLNKFYRHKDYLNICPVYHLDSGLTFHSLKNILGLKLYQEMEERVVAKSIFLNYLDHSFILKNNLFQNQNVYYLIYEANWNNISRRGIDATKSLYVPVNSSSVMALQLAIYMGFKEIYLLGVDHDWLLRFPERRPLHFYSSYNNLIEREGLQEWDRYDRLEIWFMHYHDLWAQYRLLGQLAQTKGISIYNATAGGLLDVFERVDYNSLIKK